MRLNYTATIKHFTRANKAVFEHEIDL